MDWEIDKDILIGNSASEIAISPGVCPVCKYSWTELIKGIQGKSAEMQIRWMLHDLENMNLEQIPHCGRELRDITRLLDEAQKD